MKAILTLAVLGALVWFMWPGLRRVIRDFSRPRQGTSQQGARGERSRPAPDGLEADDLVKCATCGTYVSVTPRLACERADCPARAGTP